MSVPVDAHRRLFYHDLLDMSPTSGILGSSGPCSPTRPLNRSVYATFACEPTASPATAIDLCFVRKILIRRVNHLFAGQSGKSIDGRRHWWRGLTPCHPPGAVFEGVFVRSLVCPPTHFRQRRGNKNLPLRMLHYTQERYPFSSRCLQRLQRLDVGDWALRYRVRRVAHCEAWEMVDSGQDS